MFPDRLVSQFTDIEPTERRSGWRVVGVSVPTVEVDLNAVKARRIYKDLNIGLGLRNVFADFNYKQLMEIKKLHLLYAHQRAKLVPSSSSVYRPPTDKPSQ